VIAHFQFTLTVTESSFKLKLNRYSSTGIHQRFTMPRPAQYDRDTALQKAVALFWEKGYHASSMKQIEHALDMRPGSLYATFRNKDGLFSEALATYAARGGQELAEHMDGYELIVDGLQDYLRRVAQSCTSEKIPSRAVGIHRQQAGTGASGGSHTAGGGSVLHRTA
jgi:AcrR family transcriptional regulator